MVDKSEVQDKGHSVIKGSSRREEEQKSKMDSGSAATAIGNGDLQEMGAQCLDSGQRSAGVQVGLRPVRRDGNCHPQMVLLIPFTSNYSPTSHNDLGN